MKHRQTWRDLNSRAFYARADLVLDILTAALVAAFFLALVMHEFNLWSK